MARYSAMGPYEEPPEAALANSDLVARLKIGAQLNPPIRRHSTGAMPMSHRFP